MRAVFSILKNILLWSYPRGSWQYDLLCILILAFILLTPSEWYHSTPAPHPISVEQPAASEAGEATTQRPEEKSVNDNEAPEGKKANIRP